MSKQRPRFDLSHPKGKESLLAHAEKELAAGHSAVYQQVGDPRSIDQNSLSFALYTQIAAQSEDRSISEIRSQCKLDYGVPLQCAADLDYYEVWVQSIGMLDYERQLIAVREFPVTSKMSKATFSQYVDEIIRVYTQQGLALADPRLQDHYR